LDPVDRAERPQSDRFSRHQQFWKLGRDGGSLNATSRFRVLTHNAHWINNVDGFDDDKIQTS